MATYKTPGVFIEEIPKLPPSIAEVETAIPAFIGYTQVSNKGADGTIYPTRITSLLEYTTLFGTAAATTVNVVLDAADFHVISAKVAADPVNTMYYHMQMYFANGGGPCYIVSVGAATGTITDETDLAKGLDAIARFDEPTLLVFPEGVALAADKLGILYKSALTQAATLKDRFVIMDCKADSAANLRDNTGTDNLKYGAAYLPSLKTGISYVFDDTTVKFNTDGSTTFTATAASIKATNNVGYNTAIAAANGLGITLPPSATIAGVYASVDSTRGVWKAPANVSLNYVNGLTKSITDEDQKELNVTSTGKSINAIRKFTGKGFLVWGARTLDGNSNEWRYVPVRRFFNMVEESTKNATSSFVFEPNDANTWTKVQGMIENYLLTLWRAGALQGAKPEQAFYVAVGLGKTMTAQDILEGRMYVEVGLAAVRPAEFIVLKFSHMMAQS